MKNQDQFILVVLDQIFKATDIDPSAISPDDLLEELGLDKWKVNAILKSCITHLVLTDEVTQNFYPRTPRQIVDYLKSLESQRKNVA